MSNLKEVFKSLYDLTTNELALVRKEALRIMSANAVQELSVGSQVFVTREGADKVYEVVKINPKNIVILDKQRNVRYSCHPSLLQKVDA